jgi:signal transduction histidine kinase
MLNYSPGIRDKLIGIFVLIKVLPLIVLAWFAWNEIFNLGVTVEDETRKLVTNTHGVVNGVAELATENSIQALDDRSREAIERLTTDTARSVAAFLYDRDRDIELAAQLQPDETLYRQFLSARLRPIIQHGEWTMDRAGKTWILLEALPEPPPTVTARNTDNSKDFHSRPPERNGNPQNKPLYLEMTFVDLQGVERVKVTASGITSKTQADVSRPENTWCRAETYFTELQKLAVGEIYVSEVIGPYVKGHMIGTYNKIRAEKMGIPFAPEESGYGGKENPVGKRFQGLVRWATPVLAEGKISGYVTLALDHTHIMEFSDHIVPTDERYSPISDGSTGNYAFIWDYKGRSISHPRDYFIPGFDPETGKRVVSWLDTEMYALYKSVHESVAEFEKIAPIYKEQSLKKKPAGELTRAGLVALDCRYLNFAPQCAGWHNLTQHGGSGSFLIFWSGLWKLTTAASIPYYTGRYGGHPRGFGYVTIGANVFEFHRPAIETAEDIEAIAQKFTTDLEEQNRRTKALLSATLTGTARELTFYTLAMIFVVIVIAIWMAATLTGRITYLVDGIRHFREGNRKHRLEKKSSDEMGQLIQAFNDMADSVQQHIQKMEKAKESAERANTQLLAEIGERQQAEKALARHRDNLEEMVKERTTELMRARELMIQAEKMLSVGGLAAGMAHEINNPLAGILQNVQVISRRLTEDIPANRRAAEEAGLEMAAINAYMASRGLPEKFDTVMHAGRRAARIVDNMLSFSRKSDARFVPHDLAELLETTLELAENDYDLKKNFDFKRITIERDYDADMPPVVCEASKIQQVFLNILKNGAQAMAEKEDAGAAPCFQLKIYKDAEWAVIEIGDNGPGMDAGVRNRALEPFFTTKPVGVGTGLGLSVSYFIVTENHRGQLSVESEPGRGATFIIRLPLEPASR